MIIMDLEGHWGKSVHIDLFGCDSARISNKDTIELFAGILCYEIDMKPYGAPQVVWFGHDGKEGFSLVQLIETSCITAHFAEDNNTAYIDVFSCKEFDARDCAEFCRLYFGAKNAKFNEMLRG
jgi:S-adenosylmethionine/arginine decarboxylase-like enzyme